MQIRRKHGMGDSKKVGMRLADIKDTLAKRGHDEWEALGRDD